MSGERGTKERISDADTIGSYPVLPTNNTRIAANCCDIPTVAPAKVGSEVVKEARKRDSTINEQ